MPVWPARFFVALCKAVSSLVAVCCAALGAASAMERAIAGPHEIAAGVEALQDGDTLSLASGDYGVLTIADRTFEQGIVIESADPENPARFSAVRLVDVSGVSLKNVVVEYGPTNAIASSHAIELKRVSDFVIFGSEIIGSDDGDSENDAHGLTARDSVGVTVENCRLHDLFRGASFLETDGAVVRQSDFYAMGSDGIVAGGVVGLTVADSFFHDYQLLDAEAYHPDGVQVWDTNASRPNRDITITGNVFLRGQGDPSQGIFIRTPTLQTRNVVISHNVVHQSMGQGVYLENARDAVVENNTIAAFDWTTDAPGVDIRTPGENVSVSRNLAAVYRLSDGLAAADNVTLAYDDPWSDGFAPDRLTAAYEGAHSRSHDFAPLTGVGGRDFTTAFDAPRDGPAQTPALADAILGPDV